MTRRATLKKFGLEEDVYHKLLFKQKFKCWICKTHQDELDIHLCIDHNHVTGTIRGLLCHNCNTGLGQFKDNPKLLRRAIKYLKENPLDNL